MACGFALRVEHKKVTESLEAAAATASKRKMIRGREDLHLANRIVIKAGTSVVSTPEGYPSLSRMSGIVEHAAELVRAGKEVLIVTSGAVGVGRQRLRKQGLLKQSMSDLLSHTPVNGTANTSIPTANDKVSYNSACAAAGQLGLMSLYETMFNQYDIATSQLLVTAFDFTSPERRRNIQYVISQLLALGIVPLLNENDAVSANQGYQLFGNSFSDNDSLASLVAIEMSAQLLVLLTDVSGVFDRPPSDPEAQLIDVFHRATDFKVGDKSLQGRGGMGAKVDAALNAINGGVQAAIIAAGKDTSVLGLIMSGAKAGTLFLQHDDDVKKDAAICSVATSGTSTIDDTNVETPEQQAEGARLGGRQLKDLTSKQREDILNAIADELLTNSEHILAANEIDIQTAKKNNLNVQSLNRLKLTNDKLAVLAKGLKEIAKQDEPIGKAISKTELAEDLVLEKVTSPIGVLLVIFESRPDCLPQIAALAIRSCNGLLLKGGKEAEKSNEILHRIITDTIDRVTNGKVTKNIISLITSRASIPVLLKLDGYIDLIIPRGGSDLVKYIKDNTKIAVMGHAEGVCHVYIDVDADVTKAEKIVIDAKTDYPSACNAVETLLLHESTLNNGMSEKLLRALRSSGVVIYGSERAVQCGLTDRSALDMHHEYGDLSISIEVVSSLQEAINHIHTYGSGHTECIVTENNTTAEAFLKSVDSACVFHNTSTRFADGFRFGLGAEVGISTGRIHARGPVGVEGLLTSKWILRSLSAHAVSDFSGSSATCTYTHKKLL